MSFWISFLYVEKEIKKSNNGLTLFGILFYSLYGAALAVFYSKIDLPKIDIDLRKDIELKIDIEVLTK